MKTPIRFLRRIKNKPAKMRREILESKKAEVLISVAAHFGIPCKKKAEAVEALVKELAKK